MHELTEPALSCAQGQVRIRDRAGVVFDGHNLVTTAFYELALRAMMNTDHVASVVFVDRAAPIDVGLRTLGPALAIANISTSDEAQPFLTRDAKGDRTIGTWTAVHLVTGVDLTYNTLGLISDTGLLIAATKLLSPTTVLVGDSTAVQWTINLRGA